MAVSMIGATMRLSRQRNEDQTVDPAMVAVVMLSEIRSSTKDVKRFLELGILGEFAGKWQKLR
jgi:hypothetical protein